MIFLLGALALSVFGIYLIVYSIRQGEGFKLSKMMIFLLGLITSVFSSIMLILLWGTPPLLLLLWMTYFFVMLFSYTPRSDKKTTVLLTTGILSGACAFSYITLVIGGGMIYFGFILLFFNWSIWLAALFYLNKVIIGYKIEHGITKLYSQRFSPQTLFGIIGLSMFAVGLIIGFVFEDESFSALFLTGSILFVCAYAGGGIEYMVKNIQKKHGKLGYTGTIVGFFIAINFFIFLLFFLYGMVVLFLFVILTVFIAVGLSSWLVGYRLSNTS